MTESLYDFSFLALKLCPISFKNFANWSKKGEFRGWLLSIFPDGQNFVNLRGFDQNSRNLVPAKCNPNKLHLGFQWKKYDDDCYKSVQSWLEIISKNFFPSPPILNVERLEVFPVKLNIEKRGKGTKIHFILLHGEGLGYGLASFDYFQFTF